MDYRDFIEGYSKSELKVDYRDGKIVAVTYGDGIVKSDTIGCIQVIMEEKPREIGIRFISQCLIMNEKGQIIHESQRFIGEEFNYSGGNADDQVVGILASGFDVLPEVIDIESQ